MNKIKSWIGWLMIRMDYWIFHSNVPWDIYIESEIIALFERDIRLAKREEAERLKNA